MPTTIQLIVGLGNPGPQYAKTRHNVGAWFTQKVADQEALSLKHETKFHGSVARFSVQSSHCWLLIPSTYMNESGRSVAALARFYKIPPESILVAHDELDFSAGTIRLKQGGGHGGHNGLRDIIQQLGSRDFMRLRIGIGHPGHKDQVTPYVLGEPSRGDCERIVGTIDDAVGVLSDLVLGETERAFRYLHNE